METDDFFDSISAVTDYVADLRFQDQTDDQNVYKIMSTIVACIEYLETFFGKGIVCHFFYGKS